MTAVIDPNIPIFSAPWQLSDLKRAVRSVQGREAAELGSGLHAVSSFRIKPNTAADLKLFNSI